MPSPDSLAFLLIFFGAALIVLLLALAIECAQARHARRGLRNLYRNSAGWRAMATDVGERE